MPKPFGLLASLCLVAVAPATAMAQGAAPAAALTPGAKVYDNAGEEVGTIAKVAGDKVAVSIDGNGLVVPKDALVDGPKGPALQAPKAKILAVLEQAEKDAAAVEGALKPGAAVHSADGKDVLGTVKSVSPQGALLTTGQGDITMPRSAFFLSDKGLAVKVTKQGFVEGMKAAKARQKGS